MWEKEYKLYTKSFIPYFYFFDDDYYHISGDLKKYVHHSDIKITNKYLDRFINPNIQELKNAVILDNNTQIKKMI